MGYIINMKNFVHDYFDKIVNIGLAAYEIDYPKKDP